MPHRLTAALKMLCAATLLLLAGCSALSPYSHLTKLDLRLMADDEVNPDLNGRPSPVVVRLFELEHPVAFENADFFSLYERPRQTLAPDLAATEELELRPGETVELRLRVGPNSRYVGVLAGYRDLMQTQWRYTVALAPERMTESALTLDREGIRTTDHTLAKVDE